jgi:hypothetical protein
MLNTYSNCGRVVYVNNTFRIFPALMYCGVYNKARFVYATVCTARIQSVSFAVNFHQTRSSNLVVEQSMRIDQKTLVLPALSRTPDLENRGHFLLSFSQFSLKHLRSNTLKYLKIQTKTI